MRLWIRFLISLRRRANEMTYFFLQPIGVVGLITPWNFPIAMITRKVHICFILGLSLSWHYCLSKYICTSIMLRVDNCFILFLGCPCPCLWMYRCHKTIWIDTTDCFSSSRTINSSWDTAGNSVSMPFKLHNTHSVLRLWNEPLGL